MIKSYPLMFNLSLYYPLVFNLRDSINKYKSAKSNAILHFPKQVPLAEDFLVQFAHCF